MPRKSRRQESNEKKQLEEKTAHWLGGGYLRISVKKKTDTIENQKKIINEYLENHPEIELVDYYIDDGKSGSNFDRYNFSRLMEDIRNRKVNCIIVKDLSRFGRDHIELGEYLFRILPFLRVRFISVHEQYDSFDPKCDRQFLLVAFKNLMNDYYSKDISVKVSSIKRIKRQQGLHTGSYAPYGYSYDQDRKLIINNDSSKVVQRIFHEVLTGKSVTKVAQDLNQDKIPTPAQYNFSQGTFQAEKYKENKNWLPSTIKDICENQMYLGNMVQNKSKASLAYHISYRKLAPKDWVIVQGTHPAIIDKDTFLAVRKILKIRKEQYTRPVRPDIIREENLFLGIIFCGDCGIRMKREHNTGPKRARYRFICFNHCLNKAACTRKAFPELLLKETVYEVLRKQIALAMKFKDICEWIQDNPKIKKWGEDIRKKIDRDQKKLLSRQVMVRSAYEDYSIGKMDVKDYLFAHRKYNEEIAYLEKEIEKEKTNLKTIERDSILKNPWFEHFFKFKDEHELNSEMVHTLIKKIEVFDNYSLVITFQFADELQRLFESMNLVRQVI